MLELMICCPARSRVSTILFVEMHLRATRAPEASDRGERKQRSDESGCENKVVSHSRQSPRPSSPHTLDAGICIHQRPAGGQFRFSAAACAICLFVAFGRTTAVTGEHHVLCRHFLLIYHHHHFRPVRWPALRCKNPFQQRSRLLRPIVNDGRRHAYLRQGSEAAISDHKGSRGEWI